MKDYIEERLHELRRRYKESADIKWLHRYNEAKHLHERAVIDEIERQQATGLSQRRTVLPAPPDKPSPDSNG